MKSTKYLILFFALCLFSCNEDYDEFGGTPVLNIDQTNGNSEAFIENFGNSISRNFLGNVIDIDNNPVSDVTITIGASTAITDANGVFIINNASVKERFAYIKADKVGYIHGSRAVVPSSGTNKVTIMLLPETVVGTTSSGTVETISMTNGASVALEGNYVKEDGTEYAGNVNVIMHHLDPVDEAMEDQMPGMLFAANAANEERMLQTLGMLAIELRGDNGEDLNLAEDSTAEINIPVDPSLIANAPATIPLWYFDEFYGYWKEQGEATLIGNAYVGTVTHFSFWNCDIPAEAINLCVTVIDENDNALANLQINITSSIYGTRSGFTNENGEVCGLIPSNETLTIDVLDFDTCGNNPIYTSSIGPYTSDATETITITSSTDIISETVTGIFNNCDGNPITDGYVVLTYGNQQFYDTVDNGVFEINMIRCTDINTFTIEAVDYDNIQTTGIINYSFTTPNTNLGTLISCDSIEEFITYQVDDSPTITYTFNLQLGMDLDILLADYASEDQNTYFSLYLGGVTGIGTYTESDLNFFDANGDGTVLESDFNITFNVTAFGEPGEYVDINFSGEIFDSNDPDNTIQQISGSLHVLRDF